MKDNIIIDASAAQKLLESGSADAALLYLHILASGSPDTAPESFDEARLNKARAELRGLGLIPEAETPPASAFELAEAIKTRPDFRDGCGEAERLFGRALSQAELEKLYYIYAVQGLGGAVLVLLLNDCVEEYRRRHGESKTPSVTYIAHIAAEWANEGIATLEQAEEYIRSRNERRKSTYRAARAMGITGRSLSKTEEKYISAWLGLGFGPDEIEKAYDITALRTGKMSWKYMDSIIQSWHRKGLMTVEQIEKGDRRQDKAKPVMGEHERAAVERLLKD